MTPLMLCVCAAVLLTPGKGDGTEQRELQSDSLGLEDQKEPLQCFHCDLGFWDVCFTTETNCSVGERCFIGRGRAADVLDVKTLGCLKAGECGLETTVDLLPNNTVFIMTKHCCDSAFCNSAPQQPLPGWTLLCVALALVTTG